ncbi:THAP domain-containing protein 5-like [Prorops nasuta]|uniref:THAP domain-containing protein 5-like n=1 Tax=Prorops nasuta TaxID=863751 RepID=UPI0034CD24AC
MQSCCIRGCDSYKHIATKQVTYFKFPLQDKILLKKWFDQIIWQDWEPSEHDQICSAHFTVDDIDLQPKYPRLKANAVPTIFPEYNSSAKCKGLVIEGNSKQQYKTKVEESSILTTTCQVSTLKTAFKALSEAPSLIKLTPVTQGRLRKILPKYNSNTSSSFHIAPTRSNAATITEHKTGSVTKLTNTNKCIGNNITIPVNNIKNPVLQIIIDKTESKNQLRKGAIKSATAVQPLILQLLPIPPKQINVVQPNKKMLNLSLNNNVYKVNKFCSMEKRDALSDRLNESKPSYKKYHEIKRNQINKNENHINELKIKRKRICVKIEDPEGEDEYEKLLREVRKIKEDMLMENENIIESSSNNKSNLHNAQENSKNYVDKSNNSMLNSMKDEHEEIIGVVDEECYEITEVIDESIGAQIKMEDHDYKDEFLDPVFVDE